jgi:general secretion pathway protein A
MSDFRKIERLPSVGSSLVGGPAVIHADAGRSGWLTYEKYYGLREKPFALSSDPRFFYQSQPHASAYEDLLAGIRRRESLSVLSGEIGTGKTTLCRAVLQSLDRQTFSAFVWDPFASREDLLKMVLMDFGVISVDDLTSGRLNGAGRTELSYLLYEFLGKLAPLQAFAVLVIDEAQNLSLPLLEEIRILSDSDGRERQLQVILVGQTELRDKLMLPELRQVEQRISVRCNLEPLTPEGVAGYVTYRLHVAEATPDRVSFSQDGLDVLYDSSHGVPRLINRICDRALHFGHLKRAVRIDAEIVREAVADMGLNVSAPVAVPVAALTVAPVFVDEPLPERVAAPTAATNEPLTATEGTNEPLIATGKTVLAGKTLPAERTAGAEASAERVDEWLAALPEETCGDGSPAFPLDAALPRPSLDVVRVPLPRTHLERVARRWLQRAVVALMWAGGLAVAGVIVIFAIAVWEGRGGDVSAPAPPAAPVRALQPPMVLPKAPHDVGAAAPHLGYAIRVALFTTQARADAFVHELGTIGYPAFRRPVPFGETTRHQIFAGPYATPAQADAELTRLRATGDYRGAKVVDAPEPEQLLRQSGNGQP